MAPQTQPNQVGDSKTKDQITDFLNDGFNHPHWHLQPTAGSGHESYFATAENRSLFIKLGANSERYKVMAAAGLTPEVLATGVFPNGRSIMVQPKINGRTPTPQDFQTHLPAFASVLARTHQNEALCDELVAPISESYQDLAQIAFEQLVGKWRIYRSQLPQLAQTIDQKLDTLRQDLTNLEGGGTIASHNDICNANWLITPENKVYLIDLDSMSLDDPAVDLGALLWWYYPPEMRGQFCELAGYELDDQLKTSMRVRMAIHCLNILLPRKNSFDQFNPAAFETMIEDFYAVVDGKENPQGYN
ncbi:MAG: phosphotransferase [Chloroflexota bacterium]